MAVWNDAVQALSKAAGTKHRQFGWALISFFVYAVPVIGAVAPAQTVEEEPRRDTKGCTARLAVDLCDMLTPPGQDSSGASIHCVSNLQRRISGKSFPEYRGRSLDIKRFWIMYTGARPVTSPMQSSAPTPTATEAVTQFRAWEYQHEAVFCVLFHSRHSVLTS